MRCLLECVAAGQARPAALRRPAQRRRDAAVPELEELEAIAEGAAMDAALEKEVGDAVSSQVEAECSVLVDCISQFLVVNRPTMGSHAPYSSQVTEPFGMRAL